MGKKVSRLERKSANNQRKEKPNFKHSFEKSVSWDEESYFDFSERVRWKGVISLLRMLIFSTFFIKTIKSSL